MRIIEKLKSIARHITTEIYALAYAIKDDKTTWYAKVLVICIIAYALSPIDLIPDFIPVIGYIDDLILLPLAILFAVKLIPAELMVESRLNAQKNFQLNKVSRYLTVIVILTIWLLTLALLIMWLGAFSK